MSTEAQPAVAELDPLEWMLYHGAVVGDYALPTGLASVLSAASLPNAVLGRSRQERRQIEFYTELAAGQDADVVFSALPAVRVHSTPGRGPGVPGGGVELLRFDSPYEARNPEPVTDLGRAEAYFFADRHTYTTGAFA